MATPAGSEHWDGPGRDAWHPWTPTEVAQQMRAVAVPWCVIGGWAIDLFLGAPTRSHEDLEISVLRTDFAPVRDALGGYEFFVVGDGEVRALPRGAAPPDHRHQNWVLDVAAGAWRVDVMLELGDANTWVFRRDPSISAPREFMVGRTADGIPYLGPHGALLYKAKATRPKDELDFAACLPRLAARERTWLRDTLTRVHPGHPWIEQLA
jgi:aminoglycoside-2''-adenylyltransferase